MKRLISLDLDGTLLTTAKTISPKTKETLKRINRLDDNIITLSSGRALRSMINYYNELELTSPVVCYNGGFVAKANSDYRPQVNPLDLTVLKSLMHDLGDLVVSARLENDKNLYLIKRDGLEPFFGHDNMNVFYVDSYDDINDELYSLFVELEDERVIPQVLKLKEKYPDYTIHTFRNYRGLFLRFSHEGISKWSEIKKISKYYQVDEVIVFGDANNDMEMLQNADKGILMLNGNEALREISYDVTRFTNDEDGISDYLENVLGL